MNNHTFTPGQRVSDTGKNITGTVADDPAMVAEYPGMIPVHWDNGDRSVASPSILAPAPGPAPDTRVIHHATGVRGTLKSSNGDTADVEWDAAGVAMPFATLPVADLMWSGDDHLEPAPAGIEASTDSEIEAELERRRAASHAAALIKAIDLLRATPKLATQKTGTTELIVAALENDLPVAATFEAWGIVAGAGK